MLYEFGLLRNLDEEKGVCSLLRGIREFLGDRDPRNELSCWKEFFDPALHKRIIGSKINKDKDTRRRFGSGATKVLWFVFGHTYPMFDTLTSKAVGRERYEDSDGKRTNPFDAQFRFFTRLDTCEYTAAQRRTQAQLEKHVAETGHDFRSGHFPAAERVLDKALMLRGMSKGESKDINHPFLDNQLLDKYCKLHDPNGSWANCANAIEKQPEVKAFGDLFVRTRKTSAQ